MGASFLQGCAFSRELVFFQHSLSEETWSFPSLLSLFPFFSQESTEWHISSGLWVYPAAAQSVCARVSCLGAGSRGPSGSGGLAHGLFSCVTANSVHRTRS